MPNNAIFLDRDDTIIEDPGYISSPEQVKLLDGVAPALAKMSSMGYKLIVVSNQSGVARGIVTEQVLEKIHDRLRELLAREDVQLDAIYYCPYHPDGVIPKYRKESNNRKPNPGMLLQASKEMKIDLSQSWCIGNSIRDIEAGNKAGCKTILIDSPSRQKKLESGKIKPDFEAVNIREALNIIKKQRRTPQIQQTPAIKETSTKVEPQSQNSENESIQESELQKESQAEPTQSSSSEETENTTQIGKIHKASSVSVPQENPEQENTVNRTEQLLSDILIQMRNAQRTEMFTDFSLMRLMAGIVQILVLFCLLIAVWCLMSPERGINAVFAALGFAIVFQLMSLTFYNMQNKK